MHYALAFAEQVIGDDAAVAAPPDGLSTHNRTSVLAAQFPQSSKACGERRRQGIIGIIAESAHAPIGIWRRFYISCFSSKTAKRGDMFIADMPRRQRFGEAVAVELRIGTGSRHRPHVDDEIDAGLPEQIDEFDDCSGGVTYGEEGARVDSDETMAPSRRVVSARVYD